MRKIVLKWIAAILYFSGLVKFSRWWHQQKGERLFILNYHRASGGDLRRHLRYLRRHYRILHLEAALEELTNPRKEKHRPRKQRTPLVLTFDDGYYDNYTHAFPLACELHMPIAIFLIPGYIESGEHFWWLEGKRLAKHTRVSEITIEGRRYLLDNMNERRSLALAIDARLRYTSSVSERETFLASMRKMLAVPDTEWADSEAVRPLTWAEVREMEESGWVSCGAHTMHHPILSYLADPCEMKREVEGCRVLLEQQLGHPVCSFAYPVGQMQHLGEDIRQAVQQAGYDWALTTMDGFNIPQSHPYLLKRIEVDVNQHWLVVAAEVAGLWGGFARLRWLPVVRKYIKKTAWK